MHKKTLTIGLLSCSALGLLTALWMGSQPAVAATAVTGRDYQMVTARSQNGGESLYVMDNKTGLMGVFVYEPVTRSLQPKRIRAIADAFGNR